MIRNVDLSDISDGKLYSSNDLVRTDCHDCEGCESCCHGMGDSILLDPYDFYSLCQGLSLEPQMLLAQAVELGVDRGLVLPHLKMQEDTGACIFLKSGRCSVHSFRSGICRLFPLGRYYEDHGFRYFLQTNECPKTDRSKIKISKWLGIPNLKTYEKFIVDWHYFVLELQEKLSGQNLTAEIANEVNLTFLKFFFLLPYETDEDFYTQFYERLSAGRVRLFAYFV